MLHVGMVVNGFEIQKLIGNYFQLYKRHFNPIIFNFVLLG